MVHLDISEQAAKKLDELSRQTQKSADEVLLWLLDTYGHTLTDEPQAPTEDVTWTDEEIKELLTPREPLTGKQIAEKGLLGGWKDMGITDSLEWLEEQRAKRRNKFTW